MAANNNEIWKPVTHIKGPSTKKYLISSRGRMASYDKDINDKYILNAHLNSGFPMATVHINGKSKGLFAHHAIAHAFLKKSNPKQTAIIHLDYDKANNTVSNIKWVTKEEQVEHNRKSPFVIASIAHKIYNGATARKLDEKKVIALKKELWNPKRKLSFKQIAAKYGIAEMNLYRIKKGEMWFHVHVEGEPIFPRYKAQLKNIEYHAKINAKEKVIQDKKDAARAAKLKAAAIDRKKREEAMKARLEALIKKRKQKAIDRIAMDKKNIIRKAAAKKAKELKAKRSADFAKLTATRLIANKKAQELKEKRAIARAKEKAKKALAEMKASAISANKASKSSGSKKVKSKKDKKSKKKSKK